jgi:ectoine hydroxylase-related dioxygenase (phytanoyl-CoA dioxygenase family)
MVNFPGAYIVLPMTTTSSSPQLGSVTPDEYAQNTPPFGSWPQDGSLPQGYFTIDQADKFAEFYHEHGFLVLHDALSPAEVEALKVETTRVSRNADGTISGIDPAPAEMSDAEALARVLCIHFPHKMNDVFFHALATPPMVEVLTRVIGPNVKAMQSMLFVKGSGKPGQAWHQDEDYIPTRDRSLTGGWIALDDATLENGCLWVLPGSHKRGLLWPQKFHFDDRFDCARESYNFPWRDEDSVPVEVKAGSIVFFNGYLLHRSLPNRAAPGTYRRALVNHYMSAESLLPWHRPTPESKVSMALHDYRDIVLVAGEDPWAHKGKKDIAKASVRALGGGGCADWSNEKQIALHEKVKKERELVAVG